MCFAPEGIAKWDEAQRSLKKARLIWNRYNPDDTVPPVHQAADSMDSPPSSNTRLQTRPSLLNVLECVADIAEGGYSSDVICPT